MTWNELQKLLGSEFRRLKPGKVSARESYLGKVGLLTRAERLSSPRLDIVIRQFVRTRKWPKLNANDCFFLRERIRFAYELVSIASITMNNPRQLLRGLPGAKGDGEILEWLLIDRWNNSGLINWLAPLQRHQRISRSAPFPSAPSAA